MTPRCSAVAVVLIMLGSLLSSAEAATVSARAKKAEAIIVSAVRPGISQGRRLGLLDDAVNIYDQLIAAQGDSTRPDKLLKVLRYRLRRVEVLGEIRMQPSAGRLLLLAGANIDRRRILEFARQVRPDLDELTRQVGDLVSRWRVDLEMVVGPLAELEVIHRRVRFAVVVVNLYEGLALQAGGPESARRSSLLRAAAVTAGKLAEEAGIGTLKHRCYLAAGRALRILRKYKLAGDYLAMASQSGSPAAVRVAGAFDFARNLIEWGSFSEAGAAIERFAAVALAQMGKDKRFQVDLHKALLSNYLLKVRAARQSNLDLADRYRIEADQALLKLIAAYPQPGLREAILGRIGYSRGDQADPNALTALELLAVARYVSGADQPEALPRARRLLDVLFTRRDKVAAALRPEAMWESATILALQNQPRPSAEEFLKLAREHVDHRLAYDAAVAAVKTYYSVQGDKPTAADRREFIQALAWLTRNWPDQPEGRSWLFELGWQNESLAHAESDQQLRSAYLSAAIDAYEKVGPSLGLAFVESRYRALELRVERLGRNSGEPAGKAAEAERLIERLRAYPAVAIDAQLDGGEQASLWVARTRFLAVKIRYDYLDQRGDALAEMEILLPVLKGTAVFPAAAAWEIRKLLDANDARAGVRIEALLESHPDQAEPFLEESAGQLRSRINVLRRSKKQSENLTLLQDRYARLGGGLFEVALRDGFPPERMYSVRQLYGDAMIETGRADEAMELFRQTFEYDRQRSLQARAPIEKRFDRLVASVEAAHGSPERLVALADEYFGLLEHHGLDGDQLSGAVALAASLRRYHVGVNEPKIQQRRDDLAAKLSRAFTGLKRTLVARIPVDVANHYGLARCHMAMGQTAQALKLYDEILASLSPDAAPELYWLVLLERCELLLDAYGDDRGVMDQLAGRIAHLLKDSRYGLMGGLAWRFKTIAAKAAKQAK